MGGVIRHQVFDPGDLGVEAKDETKKDNGSSKIFHG